MLLDNQLIFSSSNTYPETGQVIAATGVSTNVVDMGAARDLGAGEPLWLLVEFLAITSNATLVVAIKGADTADMLTNPITVDQYPLITPTAGTFFGMRINPGPPKRFFQLSYTLAGGTGPSMSISAALVKDIQIKPQSRTY
jgi:hypothetical protein